MKYFIRTYGCQMNHSDSERIARILELANYKKTSQESDTDLIVINMCSVRESAVSRISGNFKKYKNYKKKNPNFKTVITGCILPSDKNKFDKLFDLIIDIKDIKRLPERLKNCHFKPNSKPSFDNDKKEDRTDNKQTSKDDINTYFSINPQYNNKITAYVPIMTGCNNFCSYCVVPYTRGRENSRTVEEILEEIKSLVENGYKEIILLGQNVNSYKPNDKINFPKLLRLINSIPGNFWIRFLTSHPKDISEELIKTVAQCEKCTEYIHLALQSGDNDILEKMNRKYTAEHFLSLVKMIRSEIPDASITTDIIVGFPTESEEQFQNTVNIMKKIKFDMIYINKYSPRLGTVSAKMIDDVNWEEKKRRENNLNTILEQTAQKNNQEYIGKTIEVLIEKKDKNFAYGKTRSFKNVKISLKKDTVKIGEFAKIKINQANAWGLEGKIKTLSV